MLSEKVTLFISTYYIYISVQTRKIMKLSFLFISNLNYSSNDNNKAPIITVMIFNATKITVRNW